MTTFDQQKTFSELEKKISFEDRFNYLRLGGIVGKETFGFDRYLNQMLYTSRRWLKTRDYIITRDNGCDLAVKDLQIIGRIIVHHMNPISIENIERESAYIYDPEFLVCTASNTHLAIHYGDEKLLRSSSFVERTRNDTCPWLL